LEEGKYQLERLKLVKQIPETLSSGKINQVETHAFNVLTCLLNLIGENVSYYATFEAAGSTVSKTGACDLLLLSLIVVRVFKSLITDIQNVYGEVNKDFVRSLARFDTSLQDAGLLLLASVDHNVITLLDKDTGSSIYS